MRVISALLIWRNSMNWCVVAALLLALHRLATDPWMEFVCFNVWIVPTQQNASFAACLHTLAPIATLCNHNENLALPHQEYVDRMGY